MPYDVLVVDDQLEIRKLFCKIIGRSGYSAAGAASGREALELLQTRTFRLVLLDLKMPGMDGVEALRRLRAVDPHVPVYIITAFESKYFDALKGLREDGIEFQLLKKPIDKDELAAVVRGVLGGSAV